MLGNAKNTKNTKMAEAKLNAGKFFPNVIQASKYLLKSVSKPFLY